jgi:hypothetical protein
MDTPEIRLVDLSVTGARIEHLVLLRPGSSVSVELPTAMKPQALVARVIWCKVMGGEQTPEGERHLHYRSGLTFTGLTADETFLLASSLEELTAAAGRDSLQRGRAGGWSDQGTVGGPGA